MRCGTLLYAFKFLHLEHPKLMTSMAATQQVINTLELEGRRCNVDPSRTVGVANFIAMNRGIASSAVLSEKELRAYEDLANQTHLKVFEEAALERVALEKLSKERESTWTNTVEASRQRTMEARDRRLANEERRRQIIDSEEAAYQEEQRHRTLVTATEQLAKRDERMRNAYTQMLLQHTIDGREEQLAAKVPVTERQQLLKQQEGARAKEAAEAEAAEKKLNACKIREDIIGSKQAQLAQLGQQITERRAQREEARMERVKNDLLATAESLSARLEREQQKAINRKAAEESIVPYKSPRELLQEKRLASTVDPSLVDAQTFLQLKDDFAKKMDHVRSVKMEKRQQLIGLATENLAKVLDTSATASSTPAKVSPRSIFDKMEEENNHRLESHRKAPHDFSTVITPRRVQEKQRQQAEEQRLAERIKYLQELEHRFDDDARAEKQHDSKRHQELLLLQAAQKKANELLQQQEERHMAEQWAQAQEAERHMFKQLIELQMPSNINPRLAQRALLPVASPVASPTAPSPRKILSSPRKV